ncbi:MAG TPA: DNA polymerase IV [Acidimicrobiales bacterium]|nr:DNA polymerase IV [Acidimicrobiales bacterium]
MSEADLWPRAVLHLDMDCFYAAVEVLDDPSLRGKPVAVGGTGARGVVAAASYEARVYGVRSAMPSVRARRLCPDLIFLPGRFDRYEAISADLMAILRGVSPLVEPISLDEAFVDITGATRRAVSPFSVGRTLRERVRDELSLTCSVGLASCKLVAKLASEAAKPTVSADGTRPGPGVFVVKPGSEVAFMHPLPVRALWGVGPATADRLSRFGVRTIGDLAALPVDSLTATLGPAAGAHLHALAWARDDRPVVADAAAKSVSHEETYASDVTDTRKLEREVVRQSDAVAARITKSGLAGRTVTLKIRYADFRTITRSRSVDPPITDAVALARTANALLASVEIGDGVRLLGVGLSNLVAPPARQLGLLDESASDSTVDETAEVVGDPDRRRWAVAGDAVAEVRRRFGDDALAPATLVEADGVRRRRRGHQQWGPDSPE